ncbi:MAG: CBS domain-containing protein [Gemmataceae bacterium]|nr:CBS domain-containing protein [Gemmataceae bacterium]
MKTIEKFVKRVVTAAPGDALAAVAQQMERHHVGAVVIVENHRPVGIVTDRDLALQLGAHGVAPRTPVGEVMSTPVQTVSSDDGVFDTSQVMKESGVRRLPVVDEDGRLVGLVALDDLLLVLSRELSNLTESIQTEMEMR